MGACDIPGTCRVPPEAEDALGAESLAAGGRQSAESVSPPSCSFLACDVGRSEDLPLLGAGGEAGQSGWETRDSLPLA